MTIKVTTLLRSAGGEDPGRLEAADPARPDPEGRVRAAWAGVGAAQGNWCRRHRQSPAPQRPAPAPHRDRAQPRALTAAERTAILAELHSDRFVDVSPTEVWAILLDEGRYLGSTST